MITLAKRNCKLLLKIMKDITFLEKTYTTKLTNIYENIKSIDKNITLKKNYNQKKKKITKNKQTENIEGGNKKIQIIFDKKKVLTNSIFKFDSATFQNKREYNEDRCNYFYFPKLDMYFFGVFDGHGGDSVSEFIKDELPKVLVKYLYKYDGDSKSEIKKIIIKSFLETEKRLKEKHHDESITEGSTAVICFMYKKYLWCANLGDSRVVSNIVKDQTTWFRDHKPYFPEEKERIEKEGGVVTHNRGDDPRVCGTLAVSRAFGDGDCKGISQTPDVSYTSIKKIKKDSKLILATDGLWDGLKNQEALDLFEKLLNEKMSLNDICNKLIDKAKKYSSDNITLQIINFN